MSVTLKKFEGCLYENSLYEEEYKVAGKTVWMRPLSLENDLDKIHRWMNEPHVEEFWNMAWPKEKIHEYLKKSEEKPGFDTYIAYMNNEAVGMIEVYDPTQDRIKDYYEVQSGDAGLHILIGEEKFLKRFILRLTLFVMRFVLLLDGTKRIVGEPDDRNKAVLGLMKYVGFRFIKKIELPEKRAELLVLDKEEFAKIHG
ncbi:MAG: GNAT family N-acetyltransferase [Spirochaetota bacterium]